MKFNFMLCLVLLSFKPIIGIEQCIKLSSPILGIIDGVKGLMDDNKVHKMLYLGQQLNQFIYGNIDPANPSKPRIAQHEYKGKLYTLVQLVEIEEKIELLKTVNPALYQKEKEEINKTMRKLKETFMGFTSKMLMDAKGSSQQIYELIDDFCSKYGDSPLKYWKVDKNESESLNKRITTIKLFKALATDLYWFLKAMLCSLPIAFQMYKDAQKAGKINVGTKIAL